MLGGNYLWSNCPGAIIRGQSSRGQISGGQYSAGAIIVEGNCPGVNDPVGNHPRGNCLGTIINSLISREHLLHLLLQKINICRPESSIKVID